MSDSSCTGQARRLSTRIAEEMGFGPVQCGNAGIIATEFANNLVRYGREGVLLIQHFRLNDEAAIDFLAIDQGPGIHDVDRALQDGYSTGGTPGTGLGAVRRIADEFGLFSIQPSGTAAFARISSGSVAPFRIGAVCKPAPNETACGDSWWVVQKDEQLSALVVDGLGHGISAADASRAARNIFAANPFAPPDALLAEMHEGLRGTRGAAALVVQIDRSIHRIRFAGAGNIAASVVTPVTSRGLVSVNGIVGANIRQIQVFESAWDDHCTLVMHSDGLKSRWTLNDWPQVLQHHPAILSGLLCRDYARGNDDLTVLTIGVAND